MKLNIHLAYDPKIPFPGIYPREMKTFVHKWPVLECSQHNQQLNGKTKCGIYSYNRILLSNTKEGTTDTCNNMDLKQKCLAKKRRGVGGLNNFKKRKKIVPINCI